MQILTPRPPSTPIVRVGELPGLLRDYLALMKPRILILLLVTGYAAMWVAAKGAPPLELTLTTMVGLGLSCGGANAINMWWDRDIDAIMSRTRKRPLPAGRLSPGAALAFGAAAGTASFLLLGLAVNWLAAGLSLAGLLFYVCIYTMWLKRSTVQNIVIGGAAGAVPPLVGWAAVTGELSWAAVVMFLVVFVWTPPHFWALALFRNEDYRRAGVPMLPVVKGEVYTKWQILLYSLALIPTTAALYWTETVGAGYLWTAVGVSAGYLWVNGKLLCERLPAKRWAVSSFALSILYVLWRIVANIAQPVLTRRALLVSKQEQGSGWCFLTFEFDDGSRAEFSVVGSEYASLTEGDVGLLYSQGPWLQRFEREMNPAAHG